MGTGNMGAVHARAWQRAGANVLGVCSRNFENSQSFADQHKLLAFQHIEDLLPNIDVLSVCTPTNTHRYFVELAARAGVHVFCEKPVALALQDASAMIKTCEAAGVRLLVAQVLRFFPQYSNAQKIVAAGQLGKLGVMRFKRVVYQPHKTNDNWFLDSNRSGGMLLDLMVHDFDFVHWVAGPVQSVFARGDNSHAFVNLRFKSGAIALLEGGWSYPPPFFRTSFDIAGTQALIEWRSDDTGCTQNFLKTQSANTSEINPDIAMPNVSASHDPYDLQIAAAKKSLETNTTFLVSPQDAMYAVQLALAARESLLTAKAVELS